MNQNNDQILESFNNPAPMSRSERRNRIRFFSKMFKQHVERKPKIDIKEEDPEKLEKNIFRMQAWATRYGILLRKLESLGYDFKKDGQGIHGVFATEGKQAAERIRETGSTEIGDLQIVPDVPTEDKGVQPPKGRVRMPSGVKGSSTRGKVSKK
jgi:hypothetical protein